MSKKITLISSPNIVCDEDSPLAEYMGKKVFSKWTSKKDRDHCKCEQSARREKSPYVNKNKTNVFH